MSASPFLPQLAWGRTYNPQALLCGHLHSRCAYEVGKQNPTGRQWGCSGGDLDGAGREQDAFLQLQPVSGSLSACISSSGG